MARMKESTRLRKQYDNFMWQPRWMQNTLQKQMAGALERLMWRYAQSIETMSKANGLIAELKKENPAEVPHFDLSEDKRDAVLLELLLAVVRGEFLKPVVQRSYYLGVHRDN